MATYQIGIDVHPILTLHRVRKDTGLRQRRVLLFDPGHDLIHDREDLLLRRCCLRCSFFSGAGWGCGRDRHFLLLHWRSNLFQSADHAGVVRGAVVVAGEDRLLGRVLRVLEDLREEAFARVLGCRMVGAMLRWADRVPPLSQPDR